MKKFASLLIVAVMVLSLVVSAFAAGGMNKNEEALLGKFCGAVDTYGAANVKLAAQYKAEAANALLKVDLDAAACADLSAGIDAVMGYIAANGINTKAAAKAALPAILGMVNAVAGKYGMSVSVSADGYATVYVCVAHPGHPGKVCKDKVSNGGCKIVKQTGMNLTATIAITAVLAVSVVLGMAVVSKKNLLANN